MTASAPGSALPTSGASLSLYWQGPVGITPIGLNFDTKPPSSTPSGTIYYYAGGLYARSSNIEFALWPSFTAPTGAQCQSWVTTNLNPYLPDVAIGMQICIKTDQGRFGLLHVQSVDGFGGHMSAEAIIWER